MKVTHSESANIKDSILILLNETPTTYVDMLTIFNIDKHKLTNHMWQLKKYGFVGYHHLDKNKTLAERRYIAVKDMGLYSEMMAERKKFKNKETCSEQHKALISKNATMVVSSDQYHTSGNRTKVSAWSGYASMGSM